MSSPNKSASSGGDSSSSQLPAVDFGLLTKQPQPQPPPATLSTHLSMHAILRELHALQLERVTAAHTYAASVAQITALTANLQDAFTIQQQMQTKIQLLEYGLKIERNHNRILMQGKGGQQMNGHHPTNSSGGDSNDGSSDGGSQSSRRVPSYATLPSSFPASAADELEIDPKLYHAYMTAIAAQDSQANLEEVAALPRSLPPPPATVSTKAHHIHDSSNTPSSPLSNTTSALPSTPETGKKKSGSALPSPISTSLAKKTPVADSVSGASTPAFKPPVLSASMFMPPTPDEIAAEIALAQSPQVHPLNLKNKAAAAGGVGSKIVMSRMTSDPTSSTAASAEADLNFDRQATVYNYSSGSPEPVNSGTIKSPTGLSFSYNNDDAGSTSGSGVDLNGVQIQIDGAKADTTSNGNHARDGSSSSLSVAPGHTRIGSGSASAFTTLGGGNGTAGGSGAPASSPISSSTVAKQWRPKLQLRSHLDSVRSISFDRSLASSGSSSSSSATNSLNSHGETWLLSGSEDGTAQIWNLSSALSVAGGKKGAPQPLPLHSYRGHSTPLTAVTLNTDIGAFTAGLDGQVIQWSIPPTNADMYASHGKVSAYRFASFQHSDAVWSIDLLPAGVAASPLLLTAVADGSLGIWKTTPASSDATGESTLLRTIKTPVVPSSVQFIPSSQGRLAALAFIDGSVGIYDIETGACTMNLKEPMESGSSGTLNGPSRATQLVAHPTADQLISGHVDTSIRMWDLKIGSRVGVIPAHRGIVSCLALDHDGTNLVSGSHDESIRIWSTADRKIRQVLDTHQTHRLKFDESIHSVAYHPSLPYLASAGGDGIVKVYV